MEGNPKKNSQQNKQEQRNRYVQYSGLATQIVAIVVAGVYTGKWLDANMENDKPLATIFLTLFSIVASLYYLVKKVKQ